MQNTLSLMPLIAGRKQNVLLREEPDEEEDEEEDEGNRKEDDEDEDTGEGYSESVPLFVSVGEE